jgi:hypothetical protein
MARPSILGAVFSIAAIAPTGAHNGYSLSFTRSGAIAATRAATLDANNAEVAKLGSGFSWCARPRGRDHM